MDEKFDVLVIGSGLGGLASGYILSKHGYKVAIVEQSNQIGGCLQTFRRFGVKFDTGMHYIGSMAEGEVLHRLFDYLDLLKDVKVSKMDPNGYDVFNIAGKEYKYACGYENFIDTMTSYFPGHRDEIAGYVKGIRNIAETSPLYHIKSIDMSTFMDPDHLRTSVNEFIDSYTSNRELANVLAANMPLYAGIKDKTPIYTHALINNFYMKSAWRIVGGSDCISYSLAESIRKAGGSIFTSSKVTRIVCGSSKAEYVELEDGRRIEAKSFISNVHPQSMVAMLGDTHLLRKVFKDRINSLENTISCFTVYLKFKENTVPYLNYNYYYYQKPDVWQSQDYDLDNYPGNFLYMHQCHEDNAKYAKNAQLISYMKWSDVEKWADTRIGRRGEDYLRFKKEKAEGMIAQLEAFFPGTRDAIVSYEASTPLTYRDYTGTCGGSMYGIIRDKNSPARTFMSQRTKIPNLFMVGQNINAHGILGVTIGAVLTCSEFIGLNTIVQEIDK